MIVNFQKEREGSYGCNIGFGIAKSPNVKNSYSSIQMIPFDGQIHSFLISDEQHRNYY